VYRGSLLKSVSREDYGAEKIGIVTDTFGKEHDYFTFKDHLGPDAGSGPGFGSERRGRRRDGGPCGKVGVGGAEASNAGLGPRRRGSPGVSKAMVLGSEVSSGSSIKTQDMGDVLSSPSGNGWRWGTLAEPNLCQAILFTNNSRIIAEEVSLSSLHHSTIKKKNEDMDVVYSAPNCMPAGV